MDDFERLILPENLNFAWIKAKQMIRMADGYISQAEVSSFELNLEQELRTIREEFLQGNYSLSPLRPLPRPKKMQEGICIDRQYYHIQLRDQVAWIALVNVLGPALDQLMPAWSYGNRLYRPAWYEEKENRKSELEIGPYRHSSGHIYRKFQHSWPLFRRHVALTARVMSTGKLPANEDRHEADELAIIAASKANLPYLKKDFWRKEQNSSSSKYELYSCSIDLKQFFPSLNRKVIERKLLENAELTQANKIAFSQIVNRMLDFKLDPAGFSTEELKNCVPEFSTDGHISGLPTGLFVAGFLSNIAMSEIDEAVNVSIQKNRNVAHFRFVDDHTIITKSFDALVEWAKWYENLISKSGVGIEVNQEKYDPETFGAYMLLSNNENASEDQENSELKVCRTKAHQDTILDGKNPTKLLTKTLERLSAFAMTGVETLNDGEIRERLKELEWLLLADIPDREIRADTRAAFAAGQMARLAPLLTEETNDLVDQSRLLTQYLLDDKKSRNPSKVEQISLQRKKVEKLVAEHSEQEKKQFRLCFNLLMQSFREHSGKPRLFFRLIQFCRVTGYDGFKEIAGWISECKDMKRDRWAEYYIGLLLQLLSANILDATRVLLSTYSLRSDRKFAQRFLHNITKFNEIQFNVNAEHEKWYQKVGKNEFIVALISASHELSEFYPILSEKLQGLANKYDHLGFNHDSEYWLSKTGFKVGVWAYSIETRISSSPEQSHVWSAFEELMDFSDRYSQLAIRKYPTHLGENSWQKIIRLNDMFSESDQGWLADSIGSSPDRMKESKLSANVQIQQVASILDTAPEVRCNLKDWVAFLKSDCSHFDPRGAEWTALEIIRQLLNHTKNISLEVDDDSLSELHPRNITLPSTWIKQFPKTSGTSSVSWEQWRKFTTSRSQQNVTLIHPENRLRDYRFSPSYLVTEIPNQNEREITGVGRLLFGLLKKDFTSPSAWNVRGNELVYPFPSLREMEALPISSKTSLILETCLSRRSKETRLMPSTWKLFGMEMGKLPNDVEFDPPNIMRPSDLIEHIKRAQNDLVRNQIAVTENQPRQLIPFNLADFSINLEDDLSEAADE